MKSFKASRIPGRVVIFSLTVIGSVVSASAQEPLPPAGIVNREGKGPSQAWLRPPDRTVPVPSPMGPSPDEYVDPVQGTSSADLVRQAIATNPDLAATRLNIERARARLQQAGLRPNPAVTFEQASGRLVGSPGDLGTSVGFVLPLEIGDRRQRRVDLAKAELEAAEAEVADRERRLAGEVRVAYAEALAALRELQIADQLNNVDSQTAVIVQARVTEGESAPLELSLLRVEIDRLKARRALVEGRLQAAMLRLKNLAGLPVDEPLRLGEDLSLAMLPDAARSVDAAVDFALGARADLRLARLTEQVAEAGLRLADAQKWPDVSAFTRFSTDRTFFDNAPGGPFANTGRTLTFGVSVGIPINRNQGGRADAAAAILQARRRREFVEAVVRAEVRSAYARYQAASAALTTYQHGVIDRSVQNISSIRGAYELGAFRVTDLLVEQRRFVDSQREFTDALAERYRALADLQAAMGSPIQ